MWNKIGSIPEDGTEVIVQAVWGSEPDDAKVIFEGGASYKEFYTEGVIDPITAYHIKGGSSMRWVKSDTGKCVPGRIVRWKHKSA